MAAYDGKNTGGEAFSHILGCTGKISSEEMEQYFENELQGIDGVRQIVVNNVGKIVGEERIVTESVSGKDVYLRLTYYLSDMRRPKLRR